MFWLSHKSKSIIQILITYFYGFDGMSHKHCLYGVAKNEGGV